MRTRLGLILAMSLSWSGAADAQQVVGSRESLTEAFAKVGAPLEFDDTADIVYANTTDENGFLSISGVKFADCDEACDVLILEESGSPVPLPSAQNIARWNQLYPHALAEAKEDFITISMPIRLGKEGIPQEVFAAHMAMWKKVKKAALDFILSRGPWEAPEESIAAVPPLIAPPSPAAQPRPVAAVRPEAQAARLAPAAAMAFGRSRRMAPSVAMGFTKVQGDTVLLDYIAGSETYRFQVREAACLKRPAGKLRCTYSLRMIASASILGFGTGPVESGWIKRQDDFVEAGGALRSATLDSFLDRVAGTRAAGSPSASTNAQDSQMTLSEGIRAFQEADRITCTAAGNC